MMASTMKNKDILLQNKALKIILSLFTILVIWEILALAVNDSYFLPDVFLTFKSLGNIITSDKFFKVIFTAFYRVFSGLTLGVVSGSLIAALCYKIDLLNTLFSPIISIMKATPVA